MTYFNASHLAVTIIVGSALSIACAIIACGERDSGAGGPAKQFTQDAAASDDASCPVQCSLDGRSVVRSCTGALVETCRPELACGAGICQEPCAAAAADRSSNGCEFYLQSARFTRANVQMCYAAYVVNTSNVPAEFTLELDGERLDLTKSIYRTKPGDATFVPQVGPLPAGESAVIFVSDREPGLPVPDGHDLDLAPCPNGVVPATYLDMLPDGTGLGSSFHLTANAPVNVAAIYPFGGAASFTSSATLLLPLPTWGTQHIIVNAWEQIKAPASDYRPGAQIVAAEDDTEIAIRPTHAVQDGVGVVGTAALVTATYHLDKGQVLQFVQAEELSGSIMTSNKPTSVFGGHECMYVPSIRPACDFALQQLPAIEQWGSEYVGVGYRPRLGDETEPMPYRIVAARDETHLDYDPTVPPGAPLAMSAGEVATFWAEIGKPFVVRTQDVDHPIYLAAYMTGSSRPAFGTDFLGNRDFAGNGDPEFVNVVPAGQYLSSYNFFADPMFDETSLVVVRSKSRDGFEDVWLECAGTLSDFRPVGTRGDYEFTRVDLSYRGGSGQVFDAGVCQKGLQRMRSEGPFTATLWGWSQYASYAYPGGLAQRKLVQQRLPPIR